MPMLISVNLRATEKAELPPFTGEHTRGIFFSMIAGSDLAMVLHEKPGIKPYSIKPLHPITEKMNVKNNRWIIRKDMRLSFGIGILDTDIEDKILAEIVSSTKETIKIHQATFYIESFEVYKKSNYEDLLPGFTSSFIGIMFKTPTFFGGHHPHLYPDATHLFTNLINIWNTFAEENIKIEKESFLGWVSERVYIRHYNLKTREVRIKGSKIVGFKGMASYIIMDPDLEDAEYLLGLLRLGLISNVGLKRTYGMGVIKVYNLAKRQPISLT